MIVVYVNKWQPLSSTVSFVPSGTFMKSVGFIHVNLCTLRAVQDTCPLSLCRTGGISSIPDCPSTSMHVPALCIFPCIQQLVCKVFGSVFMARMKPQDSHSRTLFPAFLQVALTVVVTKWCLYAVTVLGLQVPLTS